MDYSIETIIQRLSEPEKLIDPREINTLQGYLNGHITDLEEEEWSRQLVASNKLAELTSQEDMSVGKAEILWKVSNEFRLWKGIERTVRKLKRYRSDLKDRFQVLTNTKWNSQFVHDQKMEDYKEGTKIIRDNTLF